MFYCVTLRKCLDSRLMLSVLLLISDTCLQPRSSEDVPGAILTISKNVLGRNVTDSLAPLVRVLPIGSEGSSGAGGTRGCTTPGGGTGHCEDLSNCPQLLLDLGNLRQSICFKSLFVPGVCCPHKTGASSTYVPVCYTWLIR